MGETVRLPHNVKELPLHYADKSSYSTVCGYARMLEITEDMLNGRIFLQFDGAAHIAEVFVNAQPVGKHYGGYTGFRVEITRHVHEGNNQITVRLDCTENPSIPPFGFVIDYLTYGGLYRDVWLDVRPQTYIKDIFAYTLPDRSIRLLVTCSGPCESCCADILDMEGHAAASCDLQPSKTILDDDQKAHTAPGKDTFTFESTVTIPDPVIWSLDAPYLYRCRVTIPSDTSEITFGIRTAEFKKDGFYLNGQKTFLRGLNRHQSFPYIGYAATESLQREDARILKEELCCNAVRTSHYPQSQYFLNACDELGLCVFTEIPGWQHLGDDSWKDHSLDMLREMITQYRNHPSVILWGVRINESVDDDEFYTRTNSLAHELDPSRATSGVRYLEKSHLLEDVYAFNDFSHDGTTPGCRKKSDITPDNDKPYLISEYNGHMYPTKTYDKWSARQEHALRHARVLSAAMAEEGIAGTFGWCMFDYATHEDFGSGDRICYHGVLDSFRNHKLAASTYASQGDTVPVLETGSAFDIGDYPAGKREDIYVFTNADEIRLYRNDRLVRSFTGSSFSTLPHGPILMDDMIGQLINDEPGFTEKEADLVRSLLISADRYGFEHLPFKDKIKLLYAHFRYKLTYEQGYALYGKYMGNWGEESVKWRIDAVKDGHIIKSVTHAPSNNLHIEAVPSSYSLKEGDCYDMALIRISIKDEYGNTVPYAQLPLQLEAEGAISICGPHTVTAEGGMCGTIIRTNGTAGQGILSISSDLLKKTSLLFDITCSG